MSIGASILQEFLDSGTHYLLGGALLTLALVRAAAVEDRRRVVWTFYAMVIHLILVPVAGLLRGLESSAYVGVRLAALIAAGLAAVGMVTLLLFAILLPRLGIRLPRILLDVIAGLGFIIAGVVIAANNGLDVTGVVATSAVLTAVVALSLQDTLGNIVAGLALQMDKSIAPGDWIHFGDVTGRVVELRWRHTSIETRNWETLIVPNSALVKGNVLVLGRRKGQPLQWRRWVYFNVDFRHQPTDVIQAVTDALRSAPIESAAKDPPPNCILMDLSDSFCRYAVRYWLTDLFQDDPTDSVVRTRVYFGLRRVGIPLSMPAHAVFLTKESAQRKQQKETEDRERRVAALRSVSLFRTVGEEECDALIEAMRYAPFAPGEFLTRQGAEAHWLYIVINGEVSVRVSVPGIGEREVSRLRDGSYFGEGALLTGEPRNATVVAETDVECYRLDKNEFLRVMRQRPEVAQEVAATLAKRQVEHKAVVEQLSADARSRKYEAAKTDFLQKIRRVLGLDEPN